MNLDARDVDCVSARRPLEPARPRAGKRENGPDAIDHTGRQLGPTPIELRPSRKFRSLGKQQLLDAIDEPVDRERLDQVLHVVLEKEAVDLRIGCETGDKNEVIG